MRLLSLAYVFLWLSTASALPTAPRFTTWFPLLRPALSNISTTTCAPSLTAYRLNPERTTCQAHVNCILPNMLELDKADMANAAILLGLLPVFVAAFGPDIKEIALLSSRRPLLSLLLSIGVPAVYISRPMEYADPLELLEHRPGRFTVGRVESAKLAAVISGAEYSFVALAIVNLLWVSYTLGMETVLAWKCIAFMPIAWALVPMVVHVVAAVTFRTSKVMRCSDSNIERAKTNFVRRWLKAEFSLCANQTERILRDDAPGHMTVALNYLATLMGSVHVIFGIVVFASLLFISLLDATLVCVRGFGQDFDSSARRSGCFEV
ncbi:hypothetical protein G7Y79_00042g078510 [Physcia stellaris]|nr:hypothetical protein G7Y79_00042g078510 [Physcia stellaris]